MGLTPQEALDLFNSDDLIGIGMAANEVRRKKTDPRVATYQIDRNINYTNFCTEYCSFCAFYRPLGDERRLHPAARDDLQENRGDAGAGRHGRAAAGRPASGSANRVITKICCARFKSDFRRCICIVFPRRKFCASRKFPGLTFATRSRGCATRDCESIPGGGAEILDDEVRAPHLAPEVHSPTNGKRCIATAHALGMRTTATMMFGCGEEYRHRVNHLERFRRIQEDTGGFTAFIPWIFAPENTPLGKKVPETTAFDYLKTLAISRLYLDNIDHIQSSWLTPGIKICQVGLQFGADDVGSILIEENVVYAAGVRNRTNEEELRRIITDAGYIPAQRDTLYRSYVWKPAAQAQAA